MYKVIKRFHDLQDAVKTKNGEVFHEYNVGDPFPRKGKEVSEERLAELAGMDNRQGEPLIVAVEENGSEAPPEIPKASSKASRGKAVKKADAKATEG